MTLLTSAVIAAIVSGLVALLVSERRIAAGQDAPEVGKLGVLRARLTLHLNPHDPEDQGILNVIVSNPTNGGEEFTQRVALLLKHDWERAKYEASLLEWLWTTRPTRVHFANYTPGDEHVYRVPRFR